MQEEALLDLYFSRSETALEQTKQQYGTYCYAIAYRILSQPQDAEECENETYWKAWRAIPPNRPHSLKAFLGAKPLCSSCREQPELYLYSGIGIWIRLQRLPGKKASGRAK